MTQDAGNVVVAGAGEIYIGDVGASVPTDATTAMDADWTEIGFVTEDGATFNLTRNITDVTAWQAFDPIRKIVTSVVTSLTFNAEEWLAANVIFAFGGGTVTGTTAFTYEPPDPDELNESALTLDFHDGLKDFRLYFPRGLVTGNLAITLTRSNANVIPVEFSPLRVDSDTKLFTLFSDDPAMTPLGS